MKPKNDAQKRIFADEIPPGGLRIRKGVKKKESDTAADRKARRLVEQELENAKRLASDTAA